MVYPARYSEMRIIDYTNVGSGYKTLTIPTAKDFFSGTFPNLVKNKTLSSKQDKELQELFVSWFQNPNKDDSDRLNAGFCLRCYVSEPILKACIELQRRYGTGNRFTCQDLLSFVLNDDGQMKVILDSRNQAQLVIGHDGVPQTSNYKIFAVEIIRKFDLRFSAKMSLDKWAYSLDKWAYSQTRQNVDIKKFLCEQGIRLLSDWALLNKARPKQQKWERDRAILETFHAVYRRDRRLAAHNRSKTCPDPTNKQMQEMLDILCIQNIRIDSTIELMKELKKLGQLVRENEISSAMEVPLEFVDPETGNYIAIDLPDSSRAPNPEKMEQEELQEELQLFLESQLLNCLNQGIEQGISNRINDLKGRRRYAALAVKIKPGFRLYCQGKSQKEIAASLGMTSQSQVSRVLEPKDLLSKVRFRTVEEFLKIILDRARELGLINVAPQPDYLDNLINQIEAFVDEKIFHLAAAEIARGQTRGQINRPMDSLYAKQMLSYLDSCLEDI